jgi:hypothetical protein
MVPRTSKSSREDNLDIRLRLIPGAHTLHRGSKRFSCLPQRALTPYKSARIYECFPFICRITPMPCS